MKSIKADDIIDLKGFPCPMNSAKAILKLNTMLIGEILEIIIDEGEPRDNVPSSIEDEPGFRIVSIDQSEDKSWHLFVEVVK